MVVLVIGLPLFRLLWPLALLNAWGRRGRRVGDPRGDYFVGTVVKALLRQALVVEWRVLREARYGRGTSWCVIASRRESR
jgi:hypothetical protein